MSAAVITATLTSKYAEMKLIHTFGTLAINSGDYSTGGVSCDMQALLATQGILTTKNPLWVKAQGISGFVYEFDAANKKLVIRSGGGVTPAGTISAPVFTGTAPAAHTHDLFLNDAEVADGATTRVNAGANLLGANTGGDLTVTGVANTAGHGGILQVVGPTPAGTNSVPVFTGTASTRGSLTELANATPVLAGVVSDTITFYAVFPKA